MIFVPAGLAHSFTNAGNGGSELWILAYSDQPYDPGDTVIYTPDPRCPRVRTARFREEFGKN